MPANVAVIAEENAKLRREWEAEQRLQQAIAKQRTAVFTPDPNKSAEENAKLKREWEGEQKLQVWPHAVISLSGTHVRVCLCGWTAGGSRHAAQKQGS